MYKSYDVNVLFNNTISQTVNHINRHVLYHSIHTDVWLYIYTYIVIDTLYDMADIIIVSSELKLYIVKGIDCNNNNLLYVNVKQFKYDIKNLQLLQNNNNYKLISKLLHNKAIYASEQQTEQINTITKHVVDNKKLLLVNIADLIQTLFDNNETTLSNRIELVHNLHNKPNTTITHSLIQQLCEQQGIYDYTHIATECKLSQRNMFKWYYSDNGNVDIFDNNELHKLTKFYMLHTSLYNNSDSSRKDIVHRHKRVKTEVEQVNNTSNTVVNTSDKEVSLLDQIAEIALADSKQHSNIQQQQEHVNMEYNKDKKIRPTKRPLEERMIEHYNKPYDSLTKFRNSIHKHQTTIAYVSKLSRIDEYILSRWLNNKGELNDEQLLRLDKWYEKTNYVTHND